MMEAPTHEFQTDDAPGGLLFEQTVEDATAYFAIVLDTDTDTANEPARDAVLETGVRAVLATDGIATPTRVARELTERNQSDDELPAAERTITTLIRRLNDLTAANESESGTYRPSWLDAHEHGAAPNTSHPTGGD